ncbi:MAG TPA: FAD-binding oxidoreductase [Vineibacter sp.]|nr:FAD-binding oxidoreductase [Vineibacter sp.]
MTDVTARDDDTEIGALDGGWAQRRLSDSTGRTVATQLVCRPDRPSRLQSAIPAPEGRSLIARGGGQSLGDGALNDGGAVALTVRLDRMLSFDAQSRILIAEAGVTIGDILRTFLPRAHMPAVCPTPATATLGGIIAADSYGSNHVRAGSFGQHVVWLDLITPRDGLRRVSPDQDADVFDATIGGMGLTGLIVRAAIRLVPAASAFVTVHRRAVRSLDALIDELATAARAHDYAAAWIDALADGAAQGRGVLETADIAAAGKRKWTPMPLDAAAGLSATIKNALPLRALNAQRFRRAMKGRSAMLALDRFLFQQDRIASSREPEDRHRFARFHCVLPRDGATAAVRRLFDIARRGGGASCVAAHAVADEGRGHLSVARPGIGLTLDLPAPVAVANLMHRLERETLDRGGRVFLASDSHLTDHGFAAMYPRLAAFRTVLAAVDPDMRLQSDLARRLRLRDYIV